MQPTTKSFCLLFVIYTLLVFLIISKSYCDTNGYVSPDGASYLQLADQLIAVPHAGFYLKDYLAANGQSFFSKWPVGYPCLIAFLAKASGLSSYWAAKVLNLGLILLAFTLLYRLFKVDAWLYSLLFLSGALLEVHSQTWSEVPFIFGLLGYAYAYYQWEISGKNRYLGWLFLMACWLFLARYIGAFIIFTTLVFAGRQVVKKQYKKAIQLVGLAFFTACFVIGYLYNNRLHALYDTGTIRHDAHESHFILLKYLFSNQVFELNFVAFNDDNLWLFIVTFLIQIALCLPIAHYLYRQRKKWNKQDFFKHPAVPIFLLIGSTYWLSITGLRWVKLFAMFTYRTLSPASFMFYLAILCALLSLNNAVIRRHTRTALLSLAALSIYINQANWHNTNKYPQHLEQLQQHYAVLPNNSLVAFGSYHLKYLAPHLSQALPHYLASYHKKESATLKKESMPNFINRLEAGSAEHIFIETARPLKAFHQYHESVYIFMNKHKEEVFFKVK